MSTQEPDLLKVVWAYVVEHGQVTDGEWNYYGCGWQVPRLQKPGTPYYYEDREATARALKAVRDIGVDWDRTKMPESSTNSTFEGTDADSRRVESLLGTLVLKDGSDYVFGVDNSEKRFVEYVNEVKGYIDDKTRVSRIFGE